MQRLAFSLDDPLCQASQRARDAMQDLYAASYYSGGGAESGQSGPGNEPQLIVSRC